MLWKSSNVFILLAGITVMNPRTRETTFNDKLAKPTMFHPIKRGIAQGCSIGISLIIVEGRLNKDTI